MDSPDSDRVSSSGGDLFTSNDKQRDESKRTARKIGEKLRRERLNSHLTQLSEQVPWIAQSERRLDKVSILRLTVNYMKLHHGLKKRKISCIWQPSIEDKQMIRGYLQEAVDGFMIVVSKTGSVIFVSQAINKFLGHAQVDVIGNSIYSIVHPNDHDLLDMQFSSKEGQESHVIQEDESQTKFTQINSTFNEHRSFYIHMQNLTNGENESDYNLVHVLGHVRFDTSHTNTKQKKNSGVDDTWLVALCRIADKKPIVEISQFYANKNEFISQHAMDGKVLFTDQRVAVITGHMASERVGQSVYSLINPEDLDAVAVSHMKIMTDGEIPSTIFRIITVTGAQIHIQSRSVIIKDAVTKNPKYIVSVNVCLGQQEGHNLLEEQKKRVKALISATKGLSLNDSADTGDNVSTSVQDIETNSSLSKVSDGDCSSSSELKVDRHNNANSTTSVSKEIPSGSCNLTACVSESHSNDCCYFKQMNGEIRGKKRHLDDEREGDSVSSSVQVMSLSGLAQNNGQSMKEDNQYLVQSKGNSHSTSLLKSLLLSDDTNKDREILKDNSMISELNSNSQSSINSLQSDDSSSTRSDNYHQINSSYCSDMSSSLGISPSSISNSQSPEADISMSSMEAFQNTVSLKDDGLNTDLPNIPTGCHTDNLDRNSISCFQHLTTHKNYDLPPVTNSHLLSYKNSQTKNHLSNGQWNLVNILQDHVNKTSLSEAESICQETPQSCESLVLKDRKHETDYRKTKTWTSAFQNGGAKIDRIRNLNSLHLEDDHINQNGQNLHVHCCSLDRFMNATQKMGKFEEGYCNSIRPTNGILSKDVEQCSDIDTTGKMSKDHQDKETKVKMLLAHQLHMKHNQIDNSLKNQTEEIDCMKTQMKLLQEVNNTSLVTRFMEQLSDLQDEVCKQKKLLIDLKNETLLPDMALKKS